MIIIPANPMPTAIQRSRVTASPRMKAERAVISSGQIAAIAGTVASFRCANATENSTISATRSSARTPWSQGRSVLNASITPRVDRRLCQTIATAKPAKNT